jgi:hypothetical protein
MGSSLLPGRFLLDPMPTPSPGCSAPAVRPCQQLVVEYSDCVTPHKDDGARTCLTQINAIIMWGLPCQVCQFASTTTLQSNHLGSRRASSVPFGLSAPLLNFFSFQKQDAYKSDWIVKVQSCTCACAYWLIGSPWTREPLWMSSLPSPYDD